MSPVEVQVSSGLAQGQGLWVQETWSRSLRHKPSWRRLPWTPLQSCGADDPQTAGQLYQRNSRTGKKVLGPIADFPTWGSGKRTENLQRIWLWRSVRFDYRTYMDWRNRLSEGTNKTSHHQDPGERGNGPTRGWPRLACECPGVSGGGVGPRWPAAGYRALGVAEWAQGLLKDVPITFITSTLVWSQIKQQERNTALPIEQKIGLKIYWALPCPSQQDPFSPTVSLS